MRYEFEIEVDCANCAAKIEESIKKIEGVLNSSVNFMTQKLILELDDNLNYAKMMKKIIKTAKKIEPDCEIKL